MAEKIKYIGNVRPTASQLSTLKLIVDSAPEMIALECFSNLDTDSSAEDLPRGIAMYFPPDALVDATLISSDAFETLAVARILHGPYGTKTLDDNALPKGVGAYYKLRDDHRTKDYFLVATGTAHDAVSVLKEKIAMTTPTYGQLSSLIHDAICEAACDAERKLMDMAEQCSVSIQCCPDRSVQRQGINQGYPEKALPTWSQRNFVIESRKYNGQPAICISNGVTSSNDYVFVKSERGIHVYPMIKAKVPVMVPVSSSIATLPTLKQTLKSAGWDAERHTELMVAL